MRQPVRAKLGPVRGLAWLKDHLQADGNVGIVQLCAAPAKVLGRLYEPDSGGRWPNNSQSLRLPTWLESFIAQDRVAFRIHAGFGMVLNRLGAPPTAAVTEWCKAAIHARSAAEIAIASRGLAAAESRSARDRLFSR